MSEKTCAIIDVSGIFYAAWHATGDADISEARQRTIRDVRRCADGATWVALALDVRGKTFRHELSAEYKAHREARPESLYEELRKTEEALAREFHCFSHEGFEADDVIASACAWMSDAAPEYRITVHSADKDLCALVSDSVTVISTMTGVVYDVAGVCEKFGCAPNRIEHWLAIVGDKADNISGIKGAGQKKAASLLEAFDDVPGIIEAATNMVIDLQDVAKPAVARAIHDAIADGSLELSLKLATLRRDVPCDFLPMMTPKKQEHEDNVAMSENEFGASFGDDEEESPAEPTQPVSATNEDVDVDSASRPVVGSSMVRSSHFTLALEPSDQRGAASLAKIIVRSRLFDAYPSPEAVMLIIMSGREIGMGAMSSLRSFHVVDGKPTMSAQLMMAICLASPLCQQFRVLRSQCTHEKASVSVQRVGWSEPEIYSWTIEDAKRADLLGKANWKKYTRAMLISRAIADGARDVFPELLANMYTPQELDPNIAYEVAA